MKTYRLKDSLSLTGIFVNISVYVLRTKQQHLPSQIRIDLVTKAGCEYKANISSICAKCAITAGLRNYIVANITSETKFSLHSEKKGWYDSYTLLPRESRFQLVLDSRGDKNMFDYITALSLHLTLPSHHRPRGPLNIVPAHSKINLIQKYLKHSNLTVMSTL